MAMAMATAVDTWTVTTHSTHILILEFDECVREVLHDLLSEVDHYDVVEVATEEEALAHLTAHPMGTVVICSNRDAGHQLSAAFFADVIAHPDWATRQQYLMLSTNPQGIPKQLRVHLVRLRTTILPKPFDMEVLLTAVRDAAERLAASQRQRQRVARLA
jgi:DNA-binding NarL/FixJ family response regulator